MERNQPGPARQKFAGRAEDAIPERLRRGSAIEQFHNLFGGFFGRGAAEAFQQLSRGFVIRLSVLPIGADFVRDKDGNGEAIMFAEVAAYARSRGLTLDQLLDQIYLEYGCYFEKTCWLAFEGAEGAEKIRRLAESYNARPPSEIDRPKVVSVQDFSTGRIRDVEGDLLPKEKLTIFELADARRIAVRPSGTEPKIKFYLFGKNSDVSSDSLSQVKANLAAALDSLWAWLQEDAHERIDA